MSQSTVEMTENEWRYRSLRSIRGDMWRSLNIPQARRLQGDAWRRSEEDALVVTDVRVVWNG